MAIEVLLVQVLVLGFTAALWWIARRDLAGRVPPPNIPPSPVPSAEIADLEQLCATLETLVTSLSRRLDAVERAAARGPLMPLPAFDSALPPAFESMPDTDLAYAASLPDPQYEPIYTLLASGITDPVEIARRTGMGRGEVDLILSLRGRRAI